MPSIPLSYRRNLYGLMAGRRLRHHPLMPPRQKPRTGTPTAAPVSLPPMAKLNLVPPWVLAIAVLVAILVLAKSLNQYAAPADQVTLKVYGGDDSKVYLGCLSCDEHAEDSMINQTGQFGDRWSPLSLSNHASRYGDATSTTSACNPTALSPPVVEDSQGHILGRLTVNPYDKGAFRLGNAQTWLRYGICGEPVSPASSSAAGTGQTPPARPET